MLPSGYLRLLQSFSCSWLFFYHLNLSQKSCLPEGGGSLPHPPFSLVLIASIFFPNLAPVIYLSTMDWNVRRSLYGCTLGLVFSVTFFLWRVWCSCKLSFLLSYVFSVGGVVFLQTLFSSLLHFLCGGRGVPANSLLFFSVTFSLWRRWWAWCSC